MDSDGLEAGCELIGRNIDESGRLKGRREEGLPQTSPWPSDSSFHPEEEDLAVEGLQKAESEA